MSKKLKKIVQHRGLSNNPAEWIDCTEPGCQTGPDNAYTRIIFVEVEDALGSLHAAFRRVRAAHANYTLYPSDENVLEYARAELAWDNLLTEENLK